MRHTFLAAATLLLSCGAAFAQTAEQPAARVGDRVITMKELDDEWRGSEPAEHARAAQSLYNGRKEALDRMIADMLIQQSAKARSMPAEKYVEEEVTKRVKPVTDAAIETFYAANKAEMQGQPLEVMKAPIRDFLEQQERTQARNALVADLKKAGPAIRLSLEPPRVPLEISASDPSKGVANAPVTIVEFSDYQCPFCARVVPTITRLRATYGDRVRVVWKDFPLTQIHADASKAGEAAHCAGEQGKYWEYHDRLFANQSVLKPDGLKQHAVAVGIEPGGFNACLDSGRHAKRVTDGLAQGSRVGVESTPTTFINGRLVSGAQPYEVFAEIVEEELQRANAK